MSYLSHEAKAEIFKEHSGEGTNTGSVEGQVALLTKRINHISGHLQDNGKDHANRRALLKMVGQRKRLLKYLAKKDILAYRALIEKLNIRK